MSLVVLILRLVIIAVLLVSGIAKIPDRKGSEEAMVGFGVPQSLVPIGALLLPWVELAMATGLLFAPTLPWAALATAAMFLVFTIAVLRVVLAKEDLDCHCFGQLDSGPVSWVTVVRNTALTLASAIIFWWAQFQESTHIWRELSWSGMSIVAGVGIIAVMGWIIWQQRQMIATLTTRVSEHQLSAPSQHSPKSIPAQSFTEIATGHSVETLSGTTVPLVTVHTSGIPSVLIFVSSYCRACIALMPDIATWQREFGDAIRIAILGVGMKDELQFLTDELGLSEVYLTNGDGLQQALQIRATPTSVLVDSDGYIHHEPAPGTGTIRSVMHELKTKSE